MKTKHQPARHSRENGNRLVRIIETNKNKHARDNLIIKDQQLPMKKTYNVQLITYNFLGLSTVVFQLSCSTGFTLQIRHKAIAQNLRRVFHFNPAASELIKFINYIVSNSKLLTQMASYYEND